MLKGGGLFLSGSSSVSPIYILFSLLKESIFKEPLVFVRLLIVGLWTFLTSVEWLRSSPIFFSTSTFAPENSSGIRTSLSLYEMSFDLFLFDWGLWPFAFYSFHPWTPSAQLESFLIKSKPIQSGICLPPLSASEVIFTDSSCSQPASWVSGVGNRTFPAQKTGF